MQSNVDHHHRGSSSSSSNHPEIPPGPSSPSSIVDLHQRHCLSFSNHHHGGPTACKKTLIRAVVQPRERHAQSSMHHHHQPHQKPAEEPRNHKSIDARSFNRHCRRSSSSSSMPSRGSLHNKKKSSRCQHLSPVNFKINRTLTRLNHETDPSSSLRFMNPMRHYHYRKEEEQRINSLEQKRTQVTTQKEEVTRFPLSPNLKP
ncbi:hypothetical protein V8G54_001992 [Vigna mungo]|uniref:Uncharacterized protein n=1 Tax=Vigna mungo TaxID=3915 RepID=A0AAQ3SBF8_VIGMU